MPAHPLVAAKTARLPPTRPQRFDPPPSTTSTRPSPGLSTACLISVLSSNTLSVAIGPLNVTAPPNAWKTGSQTWISGWASHRSVVAKDGDSLMRRVLALVVSGGVCGSAGDRGDDRVGELRRRGGACQVARADTAPRGGSHPLL